MIKISGNDFFENDIYSWHAWSASVLQTPAEARATLSGLELVGKRISSIRPIGYVANLCRCHLEAMLTTHLFDNEMKWRKAIQDCFADDSRSYPLVIMTDDPIIVAFTDGDRMEILFSEGSSARISKNHLPPNIGSGSCLNDFYVEKLFDTCAGETIIGYEVCETSDMPDFTGAYGMSLSESQSEYIAKISLVTDTGKKLTFAPDYDYGWLEVADLRGKPLKITVAELKKIIHENVR